MLATRNTYTWINKYIFPGGFLPSVDVIDEITRRHTGAAGHRPAVVRLATTRRPCASGTSAFVAARDRVLALGFDETFVRMWHFYLELLPSRLRARATSTCSQIVLDRGRGVTGECRG